MRYRFELFRAGRVATSTRFGALRGPSFVADTFAARRLDPDRRSVGSGRGSRAMQLLPHGSGSPIADGVQVRIDPPQA